MSFRVAPTVAARLAAHAADVDASDRRAAGWLVGPGALPPGTTVVVGSLRRARSCADLGADLRRAAELLPGGLEIVGAYVAGDKPEAEALVAEVKPHLEGGFAVATTRPDGSAAFHHRFSTADAIVAAAHDPLPPGWLEREYALFRCAFAARVDGPLGDDDVDADAAFAASVDAAAREAEDPSAVFLVRLPSAPSSARDDGFDAARRPVRAPRACRAVPSRAAVEEAAAPDVGSVEFLPLGADAPPASANVESLLVSLRDETRPILGVSGSGGKGGKTSKRERRRRRRHGVVAFRSAVDASPPPAASSSRGC